jgi:hypothetical protein
MALPLMPDNQEILALLASHVRGPYRFVHHAWVPYVRVAPATETEPIEVHRGAQLRLAGQRASKGLLGLSATIDFAILFEAGGLALQEMSRRATQLDSIDPQHALSHRPPRAMGVGRPLTLGMVRDILMEPTPRPAPRRTMTVRVAPEPQGPSAPMIDAPTSQAIAAIAQQADVHPDLGDYLVIPASQAEHYAPLPKWCVISAHVDEVRVVKPRLGVDEVVSPR